MIDINTHRSVQAMLLGGGFKYVVPFFAILNESEITWKRLLLEKLYEPFWTNQLQCSPSRVQGLSFTLYITMINVVSVKNYKEGSLTS